MSMAHFAAAPSPAPRATRARASSRSASKPSWSRSPAVISSARRSRPSCCNSRRRWRSSTTISRFCRAGAAAPVLADFLTKQGEEEGALAKVIVVTSGKGGVGKTTTAAAIATGLAMRGHKTVVIDFDVGLRNLDLVMGCERRVVFDFINVINGDANLQQALIRDKRIDKLYIVPPSQTRDKEALKRDGVEKVMELLRKDFEYIVCDSPAGIEHGAL